MDGSREKVHAESPREGVSKMTVLWLLQRRRMPKVLSISEKSSGRDSAHSASHPETRSSVYGMDPLQSVRNGAHITYYVSNVCPFTSTFTLTRQRIACALRRRCHPRSRCTRDAVGIFHRGGVRPRGRRSSPGPAWQREKPDRMRPRARSSCGAGARGPWLLLGPRAESAAACMPWHTLSRTKSFPHSTCAPSRAALHDPLD